MKKIAIIGSAGIPAKYGGFETLTEFLTKHLSDQYQITVFCSSKTNDASIKTHNNSALKYINLNANGAQSIPYDMLSILKSRKLADTLLILGVGGCVFLPFLKAFSKKRVIVNIDGLEWKREKWGGMAKRYLKYAEKIAVRYADVVVADNAVIQQHVKDSYGKESVLIAYGGNHASRVALTEKGKENYPFLNEDYAFKVCRIEPENNVHVILQAFAEEGRFKLVIIGNWKYSEYGQKLVQQYASAPNIVLLDPIYDQNTLDEIRSNCKIYVHGHSAGGTNPSLVEAMYLGLPVFAFDVNYNRSSTDNRAVFFRDKDELKQILEKLSSYKLDEIGSSLKAYSEEMYRWEDIADRYSKLF